MILLGKGRECTELFESYHAMTDKAHMMLSKFEVHGGEPIKESLSDLFEWDNTPFYDTLKRRLREHFKGKSYKATPMKWAEITVFLLANVYVTKAWWDGKWWR